jgi:hypothetical protein
MGADSLAKNTLNAPHLSAQFVCPSPKVLDFNEKRLYWASAVHLLDHYFRINLESFRTFSGPQFPKQITGRKHLFGSTVFLSSSRLPGGNFLMVLSDSYKGLCKTFTEN